jgi:hypothetical protein
MKIIQVDNLLQIESPIIIVDASAKYSTITLLATLNCGTPKTISYPPATITDTTHEFYLDPATLTIFVKPSMFNLTTLVDGIYGLNLRLILPAGGSDNDSTCAFIDVTYRCLLSNYLDGLIAAEDTSSISYLLHYALTIGSNCGCNCDELCEVFAALTEILKDTTTQTNDCGC